MGMADWWRGLWKPTGWGPPPAIDRSELDRLIDLAEAACDRMDEAPRPKDAYEDASRYFHQAIAAARRLGLATEVARLTARSDHVDAVYNNQFRGR